MELTLSALNTTVGLILRDLRLGQRSYTRTMAYEDFVSFTFYAPNLTKDDAQLVDRHFQVLADRYGWRPPKSALDAKANTIFVEFKKAAETVKDPKRMPM